MKTAIRVVLVLAGIFSGGCSLYFLPVLVQIVTHEGWDGYATFVFPLFLSGIIVAILCFWGASRLRDKS